ncbi:MAG: hypothetical protein ACREVI_00525 [Steroidobacteraceae bacterium]
MTATLDRKQQFSLAGEGYGVADVGRRSGPDDRRRMAVVHAVPDSACAVVTEVAIEQQLAIEATSKLAQGSRFDRGDCAVQFHGADLGRHQARGTCGLTERRGARQQHGSDRGRTRLTERATRKPYDRTLP